MNDGDLDDLVTMATAVSDALQDPAALGSCTSQRRPVPLPARSTSRPSKSRGSNGSWTRWASVHRPSFITG